MYGFNNYELPAREVGKENHMAGAPITIEVSLIHTGIGEALLRKRYELLPPNTAQGVDAWGKIELP